MKLKYELSKLAIQDVNAIYNYTKSKWSSAQANKYYEYIFDEINNICSNPEKGKSISEVKQDYRKLKAKSHFIVYKIIDQTIYIDRILHQRMDLENHLNL